MTGPIYEPKGRAREYAPLALNLYQGCTHGCRYCYVPAIVHKSREEFHASATPREGIIEALERQLDKEGERFKHRRVLLSFTSDPYQPSAVESGVTREAINTLHRHAVGVTILTKAGLNAIGDLDRLTSDDEYAISLASLEVGYWREWEPGAARPADRLDALTLADAAGLRTWVSIEPVNFLTDTLEVIRACVPYAKDFRIGPDNHNAARRAGIYWKSFVAEVASLCDRLGVRYTFKDDLCRLAVAGK